MCKDPKDTVTWTLTLVEGRAELAFNQHFDTYSLNLCNVNNMIKALEQCKKAMKACNNG